MILASYEPVSCPHTVLSLWECTTLFQKNFWAKTIMKNSKDFLVFKWHKVIVKHH